MILTKMSTKEWNFAWIEQNYAHFNQKSTFCLILPQTAELVYATPVGMAISFLPIKVLHKIPLMLVLKLSKLQKRAFQYIDSLMAKSTNDTERCKMKHVSAMTPIQEPWTFWKHFKSLGGFSSFSPQNFHNTEQVIVGIFQVRRTQVSIISLNYDTSTKN